MEKELLAILKALQNLRKIILGSSIILQTDNKNLTFNKQDFSSKCNRWMFLNEFDIKIKYVSGKDNLAADYLLITNEEELIKCKIKEFHDDNGHP